MRWLTFALENELFKQTHLKRILPAPDCNVSCLILLDERAFVCVCVCCPDHFSLFTQNHSAVCSLLSSLTTSDKEPRLVFCSHQLQKMVYACGKILTSVMCVCVCV